MALHTRCGRAALVFTAALFCVATGDAQGAEADVHFGLTRFLALKAGYSPAQAQAIATGDQRVESGDMQFEALVFDYACLAGDAELANEVGARSYPSTQRAPAPAAARAVVAGADAARAELNGLQAAKTSQAGFRLYELGRGLHVLQDSYFHEGIPDVPQAPGLFSCDPNLAWGHAKSRGGWSSHGADLTYRWPDLTARMAQATYEALLRYPAIGTEQRRPEAWDSIAPSLTGFVAASTKAQKQAWFNANGIEDTSFLAGISLEDGARPFDLAWSGRRLPALPSIESRQHGIDPALLAFFSGFFADWLSGAKVDRWMEEAADASPARRAGTAAADKVDKADKAELMARLRLWMVNDHGAVAELAHAPGRLSKKQLSAAARSARPGASARYPRPEEGLFPMVTNEKDASPLLPFIVRMAPSSAVGNARAVAVAKVKHAPYDTIGLVAERNSAGWKIVSLVSSVDH